VAGGDRWRFEPLERSHIVQDFRCGKEDLDTYLKRYALTNHKKGTARAYVAVHPGERVVWGYFTLSNTELSADLLEDEERRGLPRRIPGTLLGRMAVHSDLQRSEEKLGKRILMNAFARAEHASQTVGSFFFLVDPLDEDARRFYLRHGFKAVPGEPQRLLYPMTKIRELRLPPPE